MERQWAALITTLRGEGRAPRLAAEPAHRLRVQLRKLRYGLELLDLEGSAVDSLARLQRALGALHDADVGLGQGRVSRAARGRAERSACAMLEGWRPARVFHALTA